MSLDPHILEWQRCCWSVRKKNNHFLIFVHQYMQTAFCLGNKLKHLFLGYFDFFPSLELPPGQKQQIKQMGRRGTGYKVDKAAFHGLVYSINVSFLLRYSENPISGHLQDLPKCLLNRGCPLNRGL